MVSQSEVDRLHLRIDGLKDAMNDGMSELKDGISELSVAVKTSVALCSQCRPQVLGNGKDGMIIRLDRLERWRGRLQWLLTGIIGPVTVYAIYVTMQRLFLTHE